MKVVSIVGARPQFVKAAVVSRALRFSGSISELLVHTGQHYDDQMSRIFFEELEIPKPDYNLGIGSASHGVQTGRMLAEIEGVLLKENPDWVLVYGDTNSTLAGALAASKLHMPVAHVEAGLRSFNRMMPEEINRVVADHLSDLLFAPTETAVKNLEREGISGEKVLLVGDVMYDAALYYGAKAEKESSVLKDLGLVAGKYILATVHRAENTDDRGRLYSIFEGLRQVANDITVVVPLHPRTRVALSKEGLLERFDSNSRASGILLIDPVGYLDMMMLEKNAALIATDSGGVQKEAFFFRVPCVTLRDETEWVELVDLGWNRLLSPLSPEYVRDGLLRALCSPLPADTPSLFGDGNAAGKIAGEIAGRFVKW